MKNQLLTLMALALLCLPAKSQNWQLEWSDEFNGANLDQNSWSFETGTGVNGDFGTGQLDRATDRVENVGIEQGITGANGGALRITTRKETYIDREYTSGRINTEGKASWGPNHRIVARVWPQDVRYMGQGFAFWMMPDEMRPGDATISWPQGGEIDIMEYVGSLPKHNLGSVHYAWNWNNNEYADWNHGHHGGYYSFDEKQVPDGIEWIRIDIGSVQSVSQVIINWENTGKSYQIQTSTDGTNWTVAYSTTSGTQGTNTINFAQRSARFVRMYGTERINDWGYSIYEMGIYSQAGGANLALNKPTTSSSNQGDDVASGFAVDGNATTRWASWGRNPGYQCCAPSSSTDVNVGSNGWHDYGIDWYADRMEFFIDYNVYHIHYFNDGAAFAVDGENQSEVQIVNGRKVLRSEFSNLFPEWHPFEHKMYAILSAGVGGGGQTYGGPIVDPAEFPVDVYIDWVRVYSNGVTYNPPPTISLIAPSGIETYAAPANITLAAAASDRDGGTVSSVTFYNGNQIIGTDNTAPFTLNWNNVGVGNYDIKAVATDNGGVTSTSQTVKVAVNGANSNLALNRPGVSSTVTGNFGPNLAFDDKANTKWESLYADPQWIYVDLGNVYNINRVNILWESAMASNYQIQVSANAVNWQTIKTVTGNTTAVNDLTGLSGTGRYVRIYGTTRVTAYGYSIFNVEVYGTGSTNQLPNVNITSPGNNSSFVPPATININADASDPDGSITQVEFFNGTKSVFVDTSAPYSYSLTNVPEGTYTIIAKATDNSGGIKGSTPVVVNVKNNANQAPTANAGIDKSLAAGTTTSTLTGSATDPDGNPLTYKWTQTAGPAVTIANSTAASTGISGLANGNSYTFQLVVNDGIVNSTPDVVVVTVASGGGNCSTTNIALNKTATSSSIQGDYVAGNAFDNNTNSRWGSASTDNEWIRVDLQNNYTICQVSLNWEAAYGKNYEIRLGATNDINASTVIATVINGDGGQDIVSTNATPSGQFLWMKGILRGTGYGYSLWEMTVNGTQVGNTNHAPVANAGANQTLTNVTTATLSGSGTDADNDPLTYTWTKTGGPAATIVNANAANTQVTGLVAGNSYTFQLIVNDGKVNSAASQVTITVQQTSSCGTTNLALNKTAVASSVEGANAANNALDGNGGTRWGSAFTDNEWLRVDLGSTYNVCKVTLTWEGAYGKNYEIRLGTTNDINASTIIATVTNGDGGQDIIDTNTSASGRYIWMKGLARDTGWGYSLWEIVVNGTQATVNNAPIANAGPDQTVSSTTNSATLIGSGTDVDGDPLTYTWSKVNGATATIVNTNAAVTNITGLAPGIYTFQLVANDGKVNSAPDQMIITVSQPVQACTQNVALNKTAVASSVEGANTANVAFDGNGGTRWGSAFTDSEWLRVDLGSSYSVCEVRITWENAYGKNYEIRIGSSTDINASTVIATVTNGDGGSDIVSTNNAIAGRYVWMKGLVRGTGWGYSIWEMQVIGSASSGARYSTDDQTIGGNDEYKIELYPNPASSQLNVSVNRFNLGDQVEIITLTGQRLISIPLDSNLMPINISDLHSGMYIIRFKGTNNRSITFIKQ